MNFKKTVTSIIMGVSMIALASTAFAVNTENLYGSSAQFTFWTVQAPNFLTSEGCTIVGCAADGSAQAIVKATCSGTPTYFRIASKASYDGICALENNYNGTNTNCTANTPATARQMIDEATCTFGPCTGAFSTWTGVCTGLTNQTVTIGASDVDGEAFTQQSHGLLLGPLGGAQTDIVLNGMPTTIAGDKTGNTPNNLSVCKPMVVPFAFYVNNSVKQNGSTLTNISRMMAVMIYSGQTYNWTDLGGDFASNPTVACMRHAGSGTHATLDNAIMHSLWGANLMICGVNNTSAACTPAPGPTPYFNNGTGDEVNCVNGSGAWSGTAAIGYFDADYQTLNPSKTGNVTQLTLDGVAATRVNIRNGRYNNFYANEHLYYTNTSDPTITAICSYASQAGNVPASEANFWAAGCEMNWNKATDADYPGYVGASCPQTP